MQATSLLHARAIGTPLTNIPPKTNIPSTDLGYTTTVVLLRRFGKPAARSAGLALTHCFLLLHMIFHVPRALSAIARGALNAQPGVGVGKPHIYKARVNAILDVDQFLHMNNAAYAVHFELARALGARCRFGSNAAPAEAARRIRRCINGLALSP